MDINDYYLDINALFKIDERHSSRVFDLYHQIINGTSCSPNGSYDSCLNTLIKSGYLKNYKAENREEKINIISG
jgi:hypothetical protein